MSTASSPSITETLSAVRTLARAGVSDEALGRTVREWLGATPGALAPTGVIPSIGPSVVEPGPLPAAPKAPAPLSSQALANRGSGGLGTAVSNGEEPKVPLKVYLTDGTATNILVSEFLLKAVREKLGVDEGSVKALARQFAKDAPEGVKRTHWVAKQLQLKLDTP